jgi:hypothetical protein
MIESLGLIYLTGVISNYCSGAIYFAPTLTMAYLVVFSAGIDLHSLFLTPATP